VALIQYVERTRSDWALVTLATSTHDFILGRPAADEIVRF
jgi:hypothetical protein